MNVNLVFHGVFAFVLNPKGIAVLAPYFAPHEYLFGSWGDLEPLPKGRMEIEGLNGSNGRLPNPDFSSDQSPTVHCHRQHCPDNLFCILHLQQYPTAVHYFRPYQKPKDFGTGAPIPRFPYIGVHGSALKPSALAGPVVFTYQAQAINDVQVKFRNKPLTFSRNLDPTGQAFNLHFFAEGEKDLPAPADRDRPFQVGVHYLEAWTRLTSLIAGLDVRLGELWPFVTGHTEPLPPNTGIPGLPPAQLADLDEILAESVNPGNPGNFGGDTDCDKAHLIIDNRAC